MTASLRGMVEQLFEATNGFDVETALTFFEPSALIEDPSVGENFRGEEGVRSYLTRFFVGYRTHSVLLSSEAPSAERLRTRIDFTGTFGHEIGILEFRLGLDGRIGHIHADLA